MNLRFEEKVVVITGATHLIDGALNA